MVRFLVVGDLHGRKPTIKEKNFDYIIVPGDLCEDRGLKKYSKLWAEHVKKERKKGVEPKSWNDFIIDKIGKSRFNKINKLSLMRGREILEYLDSFGKPVFVTPGNWDQSYGPTRIKNYDGKYNYLKMFYDFWLGSKTNEKLIKNLKNIYDCQYKLHKFEDFNILGYGLSSAPEDPRIKVKFNFNKIQIQKLLKTYNKILRKLSLQYKLRNRKKPTIFVTHNIVYNTKLDKILNKKSYAYNKHFGSSVARWFCEKYQPLICIGGHIHDNFGKTKLGKTIIVNAGFGRKVNTYFEISNGKLKNLKFLG